MDPTEIYDRMDQLTAQFPDIMEAIPLPHKTDGYQRPGMAMMAGTTNPTSNPNAANTPFAVQLFSKAMGHLGGNNITAEFKNPGAPQLAALDHGDRRHVARASIPPTRTPATASARSTVPVKDIVVNLATGADGALTSTAAQVIAAINADPAASALVTAYTYAGNAGAGIVPATPSRNYNVPDGHDRHADVRQHQGAPRRTACAAARCTGPAAPPPPRRRSSARTRGTSRRARST